MLNIIHNIRLLTFIISWIAAFISIVNNQNAIVDIGVFSFGIFLFLNLFFLTIQSYFIIFILIILSVLLFHQFPSMVEIYQGGKFILIFAGLIPTMGLVRAAALKLNSVKETQKLLSKLSTDISSTGFQIASHLSGSIINTGVFPMLAASIPQGSHHDYRKKVAEASIRGMASSVIWSPFFVAFAVGQVFIDTFNSWLGLLFGVFISIVFTSVSIFLLNRDINLNKLLNSIACLRPIFIYLVVIMTIIVSCALLFNLTALSAVILIMPILILIQCIARPKQIMSITSQTITSMRNNIDDVVIISLAMMVGYLVTQSESHQHILEIYNFQNIPEFFVFITIPTIMCIGSIICVHPVISSTVLLTIFTSNQFDLNHALLMQAHLIGWCAGTLSSVASLTVITCSNLFKVSSIKIAFGENVYVVFFFALFGGLILGTLNLFY